MDNPVCKYYSSIYRRFSAQFTKLKVNVQITYMKGMSVHLLSVTAYPIQGCEGSGAYTRCDVDKAGEYDLVIIIFYKSLFCLVFQIFF